jgi:hypothetical protein
VLGVPPTKRKEISLMAFLSWQRKLR